MFLLECAPQVSITDLKSEVAITLRYQLCYKDDFRAPTTWDWTMAIMLCFHLFQSITQPYKWRTLQEASLQGIQSLQRIRARYQHSHREAI